MRAQHHRGCRENRRAHRARADGRISDVIGRQRVGAAAQQSAGLAGEKGIELALAHGVANDVGLVVEYHLGAGDAPRQIDAGDHVERRRRIAGRRDDIERRKYIGGDLVVLINRDRRRRTFLRPEAFGARIDHRHDRGRKPFAQLALFGKDR